MLKKHVFGSFNLNNSEKYRLSFENIFWGTLDTLYKKNEPTLDSFGGVHGKVCWLIAYYCRLMSSVASSWGVGTGLVLPTRTLV